MQITDAQIEKFIGIYRKHFGILLDRETALVMGKKLAETTKLILTNNNEKYKKKVSQHQREEPKSRRLHKLYTGSSRSGFW